MIWFHVKQNKYMSVTSTRSVHTLYIQQLTIYGIGSNHFYPEKKWEATSFEWLGLNECGEILYYGSWDEVNLKTWGQETDLEKIVNLVSRSWVKRPDTSWRGECDIPFKV